MSADFIETTVLPGYGRREWLERTAEDMRDKGATFFRASHPIDKPDCMYLEGWRERPAEQGPHPWESGQ